MEYVLGPLGALVAVLVMLGAMATGRLTRGSETEMWRGKYEELHEKYMAELERRAQTAEAMESAMRQQQLPPRGHS